MDALAKPDLDYLRNWPHPTGPTAKVGHVLWVSSIFVPGLLWVYAVTVGDGQAALHAMKPLTLWIPALATSGFSWRRFAPGRGLPRDPVSGFVRRGGRWAALVGAAVVVIVYISLLLFIVVYKPDSAAVRLKHIAPLIGMLPMFALIVLGGVTTAVSGLPWVFKRPEAAAGAWG